MCKTFTEMTGDQKMHRHTTFMMGSANIIKMTMSQCLFTRLVPVVKNIFIMLILKHQKTQIGQYSEPLHFGSTEGFQFLQF